MFSIRYSAYGMLVIVIGIIASTVYWQFNKIQSLKQDLINSNKKYEQANSLYKYQVEKTYQQESLLVSFMAENANIQRKLNDKIKEVERNKEYLNRKSRIDANFVRAISAKPYYVSALPNATQIFIEESKIESYNYQASDTINGINEQQAQCESIALQLNSLIDEIYAEAARQNKLRNNF